ncbi:hypothetical protein SAMN05444170_7243 [Bradyrhizobium erythrophlei]|uniref:Uncharacterized protein n=1 Tax=Bradyrhizobium erythrophlei TaxID=1437360 RepID=A0A1M7UXA5_9BRAD|nr:hypothetical protein SAMN05444170_7243 [Bradyrhizobium erythrophlei]
MATISRDNHAVWPFAVRHVGSCWLMTFPDRIPKIRCKTTPDATRSFPAIMPERKSRDVICFTKDFGALP